MCEICGGELWVCENHRDQPWNGDGCQCGAGAPCICNELAEFPSETRVICSIEDRYGRLQ